MFATRYRHRSGSDCLHLNTLEIYIKYRDFPQRLPSICSGVFQKVNCIWKIYTYSWHYPKNGWFEAVTSICADRAWPVYARRVTPHEFDLESSVTTTCAPKINSWCSFPLLRDSVTTTCAPKLNSWCSFPLLRDSVTTTCAPKLNSWPAQKLRDNYLCAKVKLIRDPVQSVFFQRMKEL